MGIEELVERILMDARGEADVIMARAESRRAEILKAADAEAERVYWKSFGALKQRAENEKKQRVALETLEARKAILEEKRRLLEEVFDTARRRLLELPEERYVEVLVKVLANVLAGGEGEVIFSPRDRDRVGARFVSRANEEIERAGDGSRVVLAADTREISGGFILRAAGVEIDASVDAQIGHLRERMQEEIVDKLFGEWAGHAGVC